MYWTVFLPPFLAFGFRLFFIGVKSGQNLSDHQLADILSADKNLHLWASVRQDRDIW